MAYLSLFAATMTNGDVRIMTADEVAVAQRDGLIDEVVHQEVDVPLEIGLVQEGGVTKLLLEGATGRDRAIAFGDDGLSLAIEDAAGQVDQKLGRAALPRSYDPWDSSGSTFFVEMPARTLEEYLERAGDQGDRRCLYISPENGQFWLSGDTMIGSQPYATLNSAKRAGGRLLAEAERSFGESTVLERFGLSADVFMCGLEEDGVTIHRRGGDDYLHIAGMQKVEYIDEKRSVTLPVLRPVADVIEDFVRGPLAPTPQPGM